MHETLITFYQTTSIDLLMIKLLLPLYNPVIHSQYITIISMVLHIRNPWSWLTFKTFLNYEQLYILLDHRLPKYDILMTWGGREREMARIITVCWRSCNPSVYPAWPLCGVINCLMLNNGTVKLLMMYYKDWRAMSAQCIIIIGMAMQCIIHVKLASHPV